MLNVCSPDKPEEVKIGGAVEGAELKVAPDGAGVIGTGENLTVGTSVLCPLLEVMLR